jgi:hypothetical protein
MKTSLWLNVDPLAEKMPNVSPYAFCGNNPISNIDPDGRYFFGLFGSTSSERRMARAERFAAKVGGTIMTRANGRPSVNYVTQSKDGEYAINNKRGFGDFSSWKNVGETLAGFDRALNAGGTNYGNGDGQYTGAAGMRAFGEDAGDASTYVKGVGILVTASSVVVGPEAAPVGMGIYEAGDAMDKVSTGMLIGADLNEGKTGDAAIRGGSMLLDHVVGKKIDAGSGNQGSKFYKKAVSGAVIDNAKNKALEQNKE